MRGQRRTLASVLAEALTTRAGPGQAAMAAALAEACGPLLAREASFRGVLKDGRFLVLVRTEAWADQVRTLEREICLAINARLGRQAAAGLEVRVGGEQP
jgi:hypothetical protein